MAQPIPYTTGNDLNAYQGNAALAAGANNGITPQASDPFAGISNTIDRINDRQAQMAVLKYKQKQKDQDDLAQMLSENGGSLSNMKGENGQNRSVPLLPEDQKIINEYATNYRRAIMADPERARFDPKLLAQKDEIARMANFAGRRAVAYSDYNVEASKIADEDERKEIIAHRDREIGHSLTDFVKPEPYLHKIYPADMINEADYKDPKTHEQIKEEVITQTNPDGTKVDYQVTKKGIPNSALLSPMYDSTPAGMHKAMELYKATRAMPEMRNPAYINKMNAKILANATERGIQPVYAAVVNPDGTIEYNENPGQVAAALNLEKHGWVRKESKLTDEATKRANVESEIKRRRDLTALEWAKLKQDQEKAAKEGKQSAESLKQEVDEKGGLAAYREVKKVFDPKNYKDKMEITPSLIAVGKDVGYNPADYEFYKVPPSVNANKYIGVEASEETETKTEKSGGGKVTERSSSKTAKGESMRPDVVVMVRNKKTGQSELVYLKGGAPVAVVSERQAIANGLKHEARYDDKVYTNKVIYGQHAYDEGAPVTNDEPKPTGVKKTIKGVTYEKYSDGQWY